MIYGSDDEEDDDEVADQVSEDGQSWFYHLEHQYHSQQQHQQQHPLPLNSQQLAFLNELDGYISDDLDISDDAGAPLVNYLDVVGLLINGMDQELNMATGSGTQFDYPDHLGPPHEDDDEHGGTDLGPPVFPILPEDDLFPGPNPYELVAMGYASILPHASVLSSVPNPPDVPLQTAQPVVELNPGVNSEWFADAHPAALSNPNPFTLGPGNNGLTDFLHSWARSSRTSPTFARERGRFPWPNRINDLTHRQVARIKYEDLGGDCCDLQGIDWEDIGVTRREARERRFLTYNNYVNMPRSDQWTPDLPDVALPRSESYFRFRRMDIRPGINLSHFQLRNVLATTSRTRVFYPGERVVHQFNPVSGEGKPVMKVDDVPGSQVSTMAAGHRVLIAGVFNGEYLLRHIDSGEPEATACHAGVITAHSSGITNHAQVHLSRGSSSPLAAFASNDMVFRVMDIATETWLSQVEFKFPLNCTALSPDRRLRVMVGDSYNVLITAADSTLPGGKPEILQELSGHRDYGFACDWADDGWTVATGFQDKSVKIWDARRWTDSSGRAAPVTTIRAEMAGVRNLRFSPVGSGKRVLVAAEEADFVNIIDAQTFRSKQTIDVFGELGGVAFVNEGQDLMVLCCDRTRGGILQLERCGFADEPSLDMGEEGFGHRNYRRSRRTSDYWQRFWVAEEKLMKKILWNRRKLAAADLLEPF
ncbi:WD40-repeat-containing domain protein [Apodospora peruviana]|uniref:WD40-repeat-containing domain protein n=1 Tax=Apodospora peruviana TaxID=516989 RepID=A0AAE0ISI2_9PEZI|nr:WD40-repeat-containing domain protein [Apodospora peruviana]